MTAPLNITPDITPGITPDVTTDITTLRREIDRVDAQIVTLVGRRAAISRQIGRIRIAAGGPRVVHSREMVVLDRFREFGREGHDIGMALLRLGRGRLADTAPQIGRETPRAS